MTEEALACNCTGIRSCLLCNKDSSSSTNHYTQIQYYWFCPSCNKMYNGSIRIPSNDVIKHSNAFYNWCQLHEDNTPSQLQIEGIHITQAFVTSEEERALVTGIDKGEWKLSQSGRRKQDFGPKANFKKRKVKIGSFNGFPSYTEKLIGKLPTNERLDEFTPVELCNLEYTPERGSSIDPHIDDVWLWGDQLVTLNLLDTTILTLSKAPTPNSGLEKVTSSNHGLNTVQTSNCVLEEVQIPLVRRSLFVLDGEARYKWMHSIKRDDINDRRLAMTFRNLSLEILRDLKSKDIVMQIQEISKSFEGTVVQ